MMLKGWNEYLQYNEARRLMALNTLPWVSYQSILRVNGMTPGNVPQNQKLINRLREEFAFKESQKEKLAGSVLKPVQAGSERAFLVPESFKDASQRASETLRELVEGHKEAILAEEAVEPMPEGVPECDASGFIQVS